MSSLASWLASAERWLDERGKGAWLVAMILGFIIFWPLGLAILFYMLWSNRMSRSFFACKSHRRHGFKSSGNTAFDAYRDETIKRLEDEQSAFKSFLQRLREAKDKTEFDRFMEERANKSGETAGI
jgi:hypothetical protein